MTQQENTVSNRVSLAQLSKMPRQEVDALPLEQIALLLEDLAEQKAQLKGLDDALFSTLETRFAARAAELRQAQGKDTGTVRIAVGDITVVADLPKKVEWDQGKLADAVLQVGSWGENPADYVRTEHKVAEAKFNAWPPSIRSVFEPARTVGAGKPTFKLERKEAA